MAAATGAAASASGRRPAGPILREPHQPHYQSLDYNPLNGGIERWFEPITDEIGDGAIMRTILEYCRALFGRLAPETTRWHVEVHQFRIEARTGEQGKPTPEGMHRDGVDYVLVLLVNRRNIRAAPPRCTTSTSARWAASPSPTRWTPRWSTTRAATTA